jgi:photosystem II stability/assembly factor-like uncharacterized protein
VGENGLAEMSVDTGNHWSIVGTSMKASLNAVTIVEPNTVVAAGDSGYVLRSTNGVNWTTTQTTPIEQFTGISSDPSGVVYLVSKSGHVRRSNDKGLTWSIVGPKFAHPLLAVKSPVPLVVVVSGEKGLTASSIDGGITWIVDSLNAVDLGHIAIAGVGTWYVAGQKWSLFRSADSGRSWNKIVMNIDTSGVGNAEIHILGFFSQDTGIGFVGDLNSGYFDQYVTTDGGASWKSQNNASFGTGTGFATPHGRISIVCGGNGGIEKSSNAGHSWLRVDPVRDFTHDLLAFTNPNLGITCGITFGQVCFFITQDGGSSWNNTDCLQATRRPRTISFPSPDLCIAAGDSGCIYRSTDRGMAWAQSTLPDSGVIAAIRMYDSSVGILYEGNPNSIKRTTDGGLTWTAILSPFVNDQVGIFTF